MSKIFSILITLVVLTGISLSQISGWKWQNPLPQGNNLKKVKMVNISTGYAVGEKGTIVVTTDGTATWTVLNSGTTANFYHVDAPNASTAYVVGDSGIVLKTTNTGTNWTRITTSTSVKLNAVAFWDANNGVIGGNAGLIRFTSNGGTNWIASTISSTDSLQDFKYINSTTVYAVLFNRGFAKSTDGGLSFSYQALSSSYSSFMALDFNDANTGYIAGGPLGSQAGGQVLKTTNAGVNWSISLQNASDYLRDISFGNPTFGNVASIYGNESHIWRTNNSGGVWNPSLFILYGGLNGVSMSDPITGTAVGEYGQIFRTVDGNTWSSSRTGYIRTVSTPTQYDRFCDVCFTSTSNGYAVGDSAILRTTDGGANWVKYPTTAFYVMYGVSFTDVNNGLASGFYGTMWRTLNGGVNWVSQNTNHPSHSLFSVSYKTVNLAVAVGDNGFIIRTTNGGNTWADANNGSAIQRFARVQMIDTNTGCAVGEAGQIRRTTNGGANWFVQNGGIFVNLKGVFFTGINNGWIVGEQGNIINTTNGGTNWTLQTSGTTLNLYSVSFYDGNNGFVSGDGIILRTTNAGSTWFSQQQPSQWSLNSITAVNSTNAYAVGMRNTILYTTSGGFTGGINTINAEPPKKYALLQNFPNPFNPITTIRFDIPKYSYVKIIVYDLLGREAALLYDNNIMPGKYEIEWNAVNFSSGLYILKIESNEFTDTKKMLLVK